MMTIRPLRNQVVFRRDPPPTHVGPVEIPEAQRSKRTPTATVVAVGPGGRVAKTRLRLVEKAGQVTKETVRTEIGREEPTLLRVGDRVIVHEMVGWPLLEEDGVVLETDEERLFYGRLTSRGPEAIGDWLFVEREKPEEKVGALVVPESARSVRSIVKVVSAGPGHMRGGELVANPYKVGDRLLVNDHSSAVAPVDVEVGGTKLTILRAFEVIARVNEDDSLEAENDFVLIERDPPVDKVGSIHVVQSIANIPSTGTVLSVGPGLVLFHDIALRPHVKHGDRIVLDDWWTRIDQKTPLPRGWKPANVSFRHEVKLGGKTYTIVHDADVLAVLE
jgi:co-chaperonin GroES (HSP10)